MFSPLVLLHLTTAATIIRTAAKPTNTKTHHHQSGMKPTRHNLFFPFFNKFSSVLLWNIHFLFFLIKTKTAPTLPHCSFSWRFGCCCRRVFTWNWRQQTGQVWNTSSLNVVQKTSNCLFFTESSSYSHPFPSLEIFGKKDNKWKISISVFGSYKTVWAESNVNTHRWRQTESQKFLKCFVLIWNVCMCIDQHQSLWPSL